MAILNPEQIKRDIERTIKNKIEKPIKKVIDAIVTDAFIFITSNSQRVGGQFGSPVFTGQYYVNHNITLNTIDSTTTLIDKSQFEDGGNLPPLPFSLVTDVLRRWKVGDTIFIANSIPYAVDIEFKKASFFKTPSGVYSVAARLIKVKFKDLTPILGVVN